MTVKVPHTPKKACALPRSPWLCVSSRHTQRERRRAWTCFVVLRPLVCSTAVPSKLKCRLVGMSGLTFVYILYRINLNNVNNVNSTSYTNIIRYRKNIIIINKIYKINNGNNININKNLLTLWKHKAYFYEQA